MAAAAPGGGGEFTLARAPISRADLLFALQAPTLADLVCRTTTLGDHGPLVTRVPAHDIFCRFADGSVGDPGYAMLASACITAVNGGPNLPIPMGVAVKFRVKTFSGDVEEHPLFPHTRVALGVTTPDERGLSHAHAQRFAEVVSQGVSIVADDVIAKVEEAAFEPTRVEAVFQQAISPAELGAELEAALGRRRDDEDIELDPTSRLATFVQHLPKAMKWTAAKQAAEIQLDACRGRRDPAGERIPCFKVSAGALAEILTYLKDMDVLAWSPQRLELSTELVVEWHPLSPGGWADLAAIAEAHPTTAGRPVSASVSVDFRWRMRPRTDAGRALGELPVGGRV